jgi:7-cyano-7-deazaguanine tRNA-ribosyltransferase
MAFEVKERDLLSRIGRLETKSGTVETPLLFPVINPAVQPVSPRRIREEFGFNALITNAYILKKSFQNQPAERGLHRFLDFDGVIMTDSGAYQILVYGDIETTPEEIVNYQEQADTDIATILDSPTGWRVSRKYAEHTVNETLKRAKQLLRIKNRDDILWVGPVQGGRHLGLVAKSAIEMGELPFQIHALGSPTAVMEQYRFDVLVDMIMAAKMSLPLERPLHLFGAGHPFMFVLAVALGCDLFDSAAYAIYARENRYMTEYGTSRLEKLEYFPCTCPRCSRATPKEVLEMSKEEREVFLAEHNLYTCLTELRRIKQAIKSGRLWEHLELRAHSHPALLQALKRLKKYEDFIEKNSPTTKKRGMLFFNHMGLARPEVVRYRKRFSERYTPSHEAKTLLLVPQTQTKPYHRSKEFREVAKLLRTRFKDQPNSVHVCFYVAPFGVVPSELDEVYPLSQHETALPLDRETKEYVASQVVEYINRTNYDTVVLLHDPQNWNNTVLSLSRKVCSTKNVTLKCLNTEQKPSTTMLNRLEQLLRQALGERF